MKLFDSNKKISRMKFISSSTKLISAAAVVTASLPVSVAHALGVDPDEEQLFTASDVTNPGSFTSGAEGPACDIDGNLYAVNYQRQGTIGKVNTFCEGEIFIELPNGSIGNGIRFDSSDRMLIADYVKHNILRVDMDTREIEVFANEPMMNQPNDIAISSTDVIYASDPNWGKGTGNVWRIDRDGSVTKLDSLDSITNGIELSPDDSILYVNTGDNNILAYDLSPEGTISNKRQLIQFTGFHNDGMRCDRDGNIYVTRQTKGAIAKISPEGDLLLEINLTGLRPSNIAFGGPDGRTCYVTMADRGNIESFRVDVPGRSWQMFEDRRPLNNAGNNSLPQTFTLHDNYPNPFNATTSIAFTLHKNSYVNLSVLNVIGQEIAVLTDAMTQAGNHRVSWNAGNATSGTYFIRLSVGNSQMTRKMMLIR